MIRNKIIYLIAGFLHRLNDNFVCDQCVKIVYQMSLLAVDLLLIVKRHSIGPQDKLRTYQPPIEDE